MAEREHVGLVLDHDPLVDERAQRVDQLVLGDVADRREDVERHPPSEHGRRLHDAALDRLQPVELAGDDLRHAPRQRLVGEVLQAALPGGADELFEEEGVAAAAEVEPLGGALRRPLAVDGLDERGDVVHRQLLQPDVVEALAPVEPGQHLTGRVAARHGVGTERADDEQWCSDRIGEPLEERDALGVGPVEVLEHDHPEPVADEPVHQLEAGVHPLVAAAGPIRDGGEQLGIECLVILERVDEHLHRAPERPLIGLSGEDDGPGGRPLAQLAHEAGLADAGLAGHHDRRRARQAVEQREQAIEVARPPDHRGREPAASYEHAVERIAAEACS